MQEIALLQDIDHRIGLLVRGQHGNRLVPVRVEFLADRIDLLQMTLVEDRIQLLQRELDPIAQCLDGGGFGRQCRFEAVLDR